jgi:glycosyltransferase involved in cell wall biosynthesis
VGLPKEADLMRIALVSTCALTTPPRAYGGTELVVANLADALTTLGHDVTVFATGDSSPAGRLRHHFPTAVWPPNDLAELRHATAAWREIARGGFDVVHVNHAMALPFTHFCRTPTVLTLHHERVESLVELYGDFPNVTYVAISRRQQALSPEVPIEHVVHHGLDPSAYPAGEGQGDYVAFLGRFAPEKAPHLAIEAALAAGMKLRMGGAPHEVSKDFFEAEVAPRLAAAGDRVEWIGEVSHAPKVALLRDARALVFPIQWEEPFGLVMIESMLVGTPVVALARGSAPEVVEDGVTGFVVKSKDELPDALRRAATIDRRRCRERARQRWSHLRMASDYVRVYDDAIGKSIGAPTRLHTERYNGAAVDAAE